jgi:hypothetical protein
MAGTDQVAEEDVAVQQGGGWGLAVLAGALACFAIGFIVGVSGPTSVISSEPQWGILIYLLGIAAGAFFGLIALVSFLLGRVPWISGSIFLAMVALMGGNMLGADVGDAADLAGWAPGPTLPPGPAWQMANATVTVTLVGQRGFVSTDPGPMGDGRLGQWCTSEPDGLAVWEIETAEVGRLDGYVVRIELWLTDPTGTFAGSNVPVPRIVVTATDDDGVVMYGQWSGRARIVAGSAATGTARFSGLQIQESTQGLSSPTTLSGEVTWSCGSWHEG